MRFFSYLIRGDTLVADRWRWICRRLPRTRNGEKLLDVGCGSGAFTIGAARRGYRALGLSWDGRNQKIAMARAKRCGVTGDDGKEGRAEFQILDVRKLGENDALKQGFEAAICCECAEHILNDRKLIRDIAQCLKPGGRLLFTAPNYLYRPMSRGDLGPFCREETGWHVRRGYSPEMLRELCEQAGLRCEEISYCSGFFSQMVTRFQRQLGEIHHGVGWFTVLPLRVFALLDILVPTGLWPGYSIGMVAYKPSYQNIHA